MISRRTALAMLAARAVRCVAGLQATETFPGSDPVKVQVKNSGTTTEVHDLTVDLRSWAALDAPGLYAVDGAYEGELAKDGVMPNTASDRKNLRDVTLKGQGGILVR